MREMPIVAIDGPSGVGKSTVARALAAELGLPHLDTGGLYRAATLAVMRSGVDPHDEQAAADVVARADIRQHGGRTSLDGEDVEEEIRGEAVDALVSVVSAHPKVREVMIPIQREAVRGRGGVVEGRDIGSVVFPEAALKVFLTASDATRAERRSKEGDGQDYESVAADIARRDELDSTRSASPLTPAEGAVTIDTTDRTVDEVVEDVVSRL